MAIGLQFAVHDGYLETKCLGTYALQDAIDAFTTILAECRLTGVEKVLIDYRALTGTSGATEKVLFGMAANERYLQHLTMGGQRLSFGYLGSTNLVSTYQPMMEYAQASGMSVHVSTKEDQVYGWLGVQPG